MTWEEKEEWADDHGYVRGRCACGRRTWSDTGVFDCGCGATIDELEAAEEEEEPEPECTCRFAGDVAYTEMCELHGGAR